MAGVTAEQPTTIEVFPWLKTLPMAPEYHPTLAEFQDPIAYIFKIEKEASKYGICKIVPPVPPPPKKTAIANLNRSLASRSAVSDPKSTPTFTTRQQQIGFCPRKHRPVRKPVWQSGESYTFPQFEAKAKSFEKIYLKKSSKKALLTPLEIETLYWKATVDRPFSVEYANDMPGSAFVQASAKKSSREAVTMDETAWNMRGVSRAKGSLLRFMKEEIPGVTSPMVYVAMMFSWFAWHVEDHDLHSLNYMHMGAGKTWYGVPRDAAVALEEVIRVHGYGGEINPIVTFATLGEKTTVMSPEVLLSAGVPCCRLVQNAGEFVVTFPRAYHSGFSHGFNCGEAANIATPEWLRVANDAAIRRASINCSPMVSHFQLLYDLALALSSRVPMSINSKPRSSRLKDKKKGEGETLVKELFVQDVIQNNDLLHILGEGSPITLLPRNSLGNPGSNLRIGSQIKVKPRLSFGLLSPDNEMKTTESLISDDIMLDRKQGVKQFTGFYSMKGKFSSLCAGDNLPLLGGSDDVLCNLDRTAQYDKLPDHRLFSCVTCGILCFACVAIIQPRKEAARYLMSADCSIFNDWVVGTGVTSDDFTAVSGDATNAAELNSCSGSMAKSTLDGLFDVPVQSAGQIQTVDTSMGAIPHAETQRDISSLGLLALTYGDTSDNEEDQVEADIPVNADKTKSRDCSQERRLDCDNSELTCLNHYSGESGCRKLPFPRLGCGDEVPVQITDLYGEHGRTRADLKDRSRQTFDSSVEFETNDISMESSSLGGRSENQMKLPYFVSNCSSVAHEADAVIGNGLVPIENTIMSFAPRSDEDSSRMHVFCLQHAVEVEQKLRSIGGVHMVLLCHPAIYDFGEISTDYPKLEAEAKLVAEELGTNHLWSNIAFREATDEDKVKIQSALDSEETIHGNGDWAVKLGINLYYSANLSRSPLYSKQMPYNSIIYNAFGRSSPVNTPTKPKVCGKGSAKQKKIIVAGKWCGKVWMSNQVHPLLAERDTEEQEQEISKASASMKTGKKRKNTVGSRAIVKAKSPKVEESVKGLDDSPVDNSHWQYTTRNLRNKQLKKERPQPRNNSDRNTRQFDSYFNDELEGGPSTRLRKRTSKAPKELVEAKSPLRKQISNNKAKKTPGMNAPDVHCNTKTAEEEEEYPCDMEGCTMSFCSKQELVLHKRNICPVKGCGKKFFSHKYLVQHRRVHMDDRPLKCPWKGCKMTFKWAWARTEHIRVHTGARPYVCTVAGCGQTFRFVSDFSRHKRKTGHSTKKVNR